MRRRAVARAAACGDAEARARGAAARRAVAGGVRCARRPACRCGGGAVRWRLQISAAPPLLCLSARDVEGRGGGRGLIGKCHRSRALGTPGTFDSLFPGWGNPRDL